MKHLPFTSLLSMKVNKYARIFRWRWSYKLNPNVLVYNPSYPILNPNYFHPNALVTWFNMKLRKLDNTCTFFFLPSLIVGSFLYSFPLIFSLVCGVSYITNDGEKMFFRKFFKFPVNKPIDVRTKFYNAEVCFFFVDIFVDFFYVDGGFFRIILIMMFIWKLKFRIFVPLQLCWKRWRWNHRMLITVMKLSHLNQG